MNNNHKTEDHRNRDNNGSDSLDPVIEKLFLGYLSSEAVKPEITLNEEETAAKKEGGIRFLLKEFKEGGGKYGRVSFWDLKDTVNDTTEQFVIKRNRGLDIGDAITLTDIEAKVLCWLRRNNLPVVTYCKHEGALLMTEYQPGPTVEEYILEHKYLPPEIILSIIDTMPKIHSTLSDMMARKIGDIEFDDVDFLRERNIRLVKESFPDLREYITQVAKEKGVPEKEIDKEIEKNFYAYRVMQVIGNMTFDFIENYANINNTLKNARKTWIGYDHPRNRILKEAMEEGAPPKVIAYDFNHISESFFGLDLAMLLSAFRPENGDSVIDDYHKSLTNYTNLAIVTNFVERDKEGLEKKEINKIQEYMHKVRDPENITKDISIKPFYKHDQILIDSACMYAAFLHRITLDLVRLVKEDDEERAKRYINLLHYISNEARNFETTLSKHQKEKLLNAGVMLPISDEPFKSFTNIDSLKYYVGKE